MKHNKNRKRALPVLLAAILWMEGTFGTVCAAEESGISENSVEYVENEETPAPDEPDTPTEEEDGDAQENGETPGTEEETPEETVSENTLEQEEPAADLSEEELPEAECALGEPPLMTGQTGGSRVFSNSNTTFAASGEGKTLNTPSTAEIIARYKEYPWSLDVSNTYSETPSTTNPYKAGHLTDSSLENALNLMNFIRYVAGIPANVTLNESYIELTQAGALVNCVNGKLTHTPDKPSGFGDAYDDLYDKAKKGCASSNIAMGYGNIAKSLLNGWMYDGDSTNIKAMGHRRWVLNPSMTQTGFGAVGSYSAMYAFDGNGTGISDFVAWPARNMPIELMNGSTTPWTVSLGSNYQAADIQKVKVTLQNLTKSKTYIFSGTEAEGVFKINTDYYGMPNCIIFRPNSVSYDKNSQFRVTITGLTDSQGNNATLTYNVDFFSLKEEPAEVTAVTLNKGEIHLLLDDKEGRQEETLFATVTPGNAADKTLTWKSGDSDVATVDANGNVKAVGVGKTVVSVTAANGKQAVCDVKVSDYTLDSDSLTFDLTAGKGPKKLTVNDGNEPATDKISWKSENESVATVGTDGTVTPEAVGEIMIWAIVEDGLAALGCKVTVEDSALPAMEMSETKCTLRAEKTGQEGETKQLKVYFTPVDTKWKGSVKWSTDNTDAAMLLETDAETGKVEEKKDVTGGATVFVKAKGAGTAKISAVVVDESGNAVEKDGKTAQVSCTVTVQAEANLTEADIPVPVALTNTQTTLRDVALPEDWSWTEPDTALSASFAGGRPKKFAAAYQPKGKGDVLPAEKPLEVHFITVQSLSAEIEANNQEVSVLKSGQTAECYVNYFDDETLQKFEGSTAAYSGNMDYEHHKQEIEKNIQWMSSNPTVAAVETTENGVKVTAREAGTATLKAQLKLGKKTFTANRKITVTKAVEAALTVKDVEHFTPDGTKMIYTGELSAFDTEKANQANSKITLTLSGAAKVTAKSSNAKVVAVKTSTVEGEGFAVSLIVKAAGTAIITLTGNDEAKTSREITLVVTDAEPGLSVETVTVNTLQSTGAVFSLYPAKDSAGKDYAVTKVEMASDDEKSANFTLSREGTSDSYRIKAKSGTRNGTYKVKIWATTNVKTDELSLTVKVVSTAPKCKVKQVDKLNLFCKGTSSPLTFETDEAVTDVKLSGVADYKLVPEKNGENVSYYLQATEYATLQSVKKGKLTITFQGYPQSLAVPFTVNVEKKTPKIALTTNVVTLYPKAGINSVPIGLKNSEGVSWETVKVEKKIAEAAGNYTVEIDEKNQRILLSGSNLNRADSFKMPILLKDDDVWAEPISYTLTVKVSLGQPAIALENKTLQLNAHQDYRGYDAASTIVKWKDGGELLVDEKDESIRLSVYCDVKDARAKALVQNSQVVFSVKREPVGKNYERYQVTARLNNKDVDSGAYKFIVQAAKNGEVWKTPLTLKVVNTAPDKAVKLTAKGSIDVLNRENSFITLTPSLKAVNGVFVTAKDVGTTGDRAVKLTGRDAHLFAARWDATGTKIELRAKDEETLVTKYQYIVAPVIELKNATGETEKIQAPAVKFKVKQGSVKITAAPKTALLYSGSYNSVDIQLSTALKGASAPEIESVALVNNTDAFAAGAYDEEKGSVTLHMLNNGRAVKGKSYSLQFKVRLKEQADNEKAITVKYAVKVK